MCKLFDCKSLILRHLNIMLVCALRSRIGTEGKANVPDGTVQGSRRFGSLAAEFPLTPVRVSVRDSNRTATWVVPAESPIRHKKRHPGGESRVSVDKNEGIVKGHFSGPVQ